MRVVKNPLVRLAIALISLMISIGLLRSIISHLRRSDVVEEHRQTLQKEEARNQELKERLKEATSPAFVEKQAREKLGLVREGDTIVLLGKPHTSNTGVQKEAENEVLSNWKRWWRLFF